MLKTTRVFPHVLRWAAAFGLLAACLLQVRAARAYQIASVVSDGCHERITTAALRRIRGELSAAAPLAPNRNERALIDDLEFKLPHDMQDLGAASLLVGVRDNDVKGRHAGDLRELALVHGDPANQREHCLRAPADDGPRGSELALADCRAFIRERVEQALSGLDAQGNPDPQKRTSLRVWLALRHGVDASLPTYYVRMGQALHALEDSFTHTYRSADGLRVTVVLNWVDDVKERLREPRDGPPHAGELDYCKDLDELRTRNRELATDAAEALLRATLAPNMSTAQKLAAVDQVLDAYLTYEPGCSEENDWCDAPEREYGNGKRLGCAVTHGASEGSLLFWTLAGLVLGVRRSRHRARKGALLSTALVLAVTSGAALYATPALAQARGEDKKGTPTEEKPIHDEWTKNFGGYAGLSGSFDYSALGLALAARYRFSERWWAGADAEWNPWITTPWLSNNSAGFRGGVFNAYGTVIFRTPLAHDKFNIRTAANLGASTLLIDLYGAPRGSTGLYLAIQPLALEWKMSRFPYLIVSPLGIAVPVPQLNGVPFAYAQYRITVGIEIFPD